METIPELIPGHDGSWIVTRRATGEVVGEFVLRSVVEKVNQAAYRVETASQYLGRLNLELAAKAGGEAAPDAACPYMKASDLAAVWHKARNTKAVA